MQLKLPKCDGKREVQEKIDGHMKYFHFDVYYFEKYSKLLARFDDKHTYEFISNSYPSGGLRFDNYTQGSIDCCILKDIQNQSYYKKAVLIYVK